jgi:hypothetical protein
MWENAWYQVPTLPNGFLFQELKIFNATPYWRKSCSKSIHNLISKLKFKKSI